jgi:hypothetical protein
MPLMEKIKALVLPAFIRTLRGLHFVKIQSDYWCRSLYGHFSWNHGYQVDYIRECHCLQPAAAISQGKL